MDRKAFTNEVKIRFVKLELCGFKTKVIAQKLNRKEKDLQNARRTQWYELLHTAFEPFAETVAEHFLETGG